MTDKISRSPSLSELTMDVLYYLLFYTNKLLGLAINSSVIILLRLCAITITSLISLFYAVLFVPIFVLAITLSIVTIIILPYILYKSLNIQEKISFLKLVCSLLMVDIWIVICSLALAIVPVLFCINFLIDIMKFSWKLGVVAIFSTVSHDMQTIMLHMEVRYHFCNLVLGTIYTQIYNYLSSDKLPPYHQSVRELKVLKCLILLSSYEYLDSNQKKTIDQRFELLKRINLTSMDELNFCIVNLQNNQELDFDFVKENLWTDFMSTYFKLWLSCREKREMMPMDALRREFKFSLDKNSACNELYTEEYSRSSPSMTLFTKHNELSILQKELQDAVQKSPKNCNIVLVKQYYDPSKEKWLAVPKSAVCCNEESLRSLKTQRAVTNDDILLPKKYKNFVTRFKYHYREQDNNCCLSPEFQELSDEYQQLVTSGRLSF